MQQSRKVTASGKRRQMFCRSEIAVSCSTVVSAVSSYRCQLVEAGKEFVEGHHQLLSGALGRQHGEALDVGKQDAAEMQEGTREDFTHLVVILVEFSNFVTLSKLFSLLHLFIFLLGLQ